MARVEGAISTGFGTRERYSRELQPPLFKTWTLAPAGCGLWELSERRCKAAELVFCRKR